MKIFITRGSGTIGSRAVPRLLQAGHEVTALMRSGCAQALLEGAGAAPYRAACSSQRP
jgi:nucleoside-diphosphate-sugar epimerase